MAIPEAVPESVRQAALAAFSTRRPGHVPLDLVHDSFSDETPSGSSPTTTVHRSLRFQGDGTTVEIEARYTSALTQLTVQVTPGQLVEVEITSPEPMLRLVVRGDAPLEVATTARGPASLLITSSGADGTPQRWQTAWLAL